LYRLFRQGAILADNMFVKKEADGYYFYVIEAYLAPKKQSKFVSLHAMIQEGKSQEKMKAIGEKIRALLQACHHEG
jgi:5-carboxymethyl-2-hydroxymuconate isomerase